jgi:hypothetical protein
MPDRRGRRDSLVAITALVTLIAPVAGCDRAPADEKPADVPPTSNAYFADTAFVGRTVAINAPVVRVITERSFEVNAQGFGDDSLLVITPRGLAVTAGERLRLRGNVEVFYYATYSREYRLAPAEEYTKFVGEEFLAAADAGPPGLPTPSATSAPGGGGS